MQRIFRFLPTCLALIAIVPSATAATITVSAVAKQSIQQDGIEVANDGDVVLVLPGTYLENIDFKGKAITVTSTVSNDPAVIRAATAATIIDGGSTAPAVSFRSSETNASTLSYFTIRNGGASDPSGTDFNYGGILVNSAAPTILGNTITHNNCFGISSSSSAPVIKGNDITATQTPATGCGFTNGSGIFISGDLGSGTSAEISGNTIEGNIEAANSATIQNGGAGIAVYSGSPTIVNNTIRNNSAPFATGGAVDVIGGSNVRIAQNLIYSNQAGCGGGAIAFKTAANTTNVLYLLVQNNTIVNNTGPSGAPPKGCFIDSQLSPTDSGYSSPIVVFLNNIITGNTSAPATNCYPQQKPSEYNQSIFDHNILYNAGGSFFGSYCIDVSGAYGNVASDPLFTNASANDFHLRTTPAFSPGIDAGNNSTTLFSTAYDFDGSARVQDATNKSYPIIDMGAYEASGTADATPTATTVSTSTPLAGKPLILTARVSSPSGTPSGTATFYVDRVVTVSALNPVTLDGTGMASFSVSLANGPHSIYAVYSGAGAAFPPSVSVVTVVDLEPGKTSVSITAAPNPALIGQNILFTVTTSSVDPAYSPSPINIYDTDHGNALLATVTPDATGNANFNDASLTAGLHTIVANFPGTPSYSSASSSPLPVRVTSPTTLTLVSGTNPVQAEVPFTLTATVSSTVHNPSGIINFYSDNNLIGSGTIVDPPNLPPSGSGPAPPQPLNVTFSASLPGGTHNLIAKYPGDDADNSSTSNTVVEVVNADPTTLSLEATPDPALAFQTITLTARIAAMNSANLPTGSISFTANGKLLGMAALNINGIVTLDAALPAGTYSIVANFAASASFAASTSLTVTETINKDGSSTTMSVSPNPGYFPGGTESLSAAVMPVFPPAASMVAPPSGVITFYDGATAIATLPVPVAAGAAASVSNLSVGMHTLIATYSGDPNYLPSTSAPVTLDIILRDFTLAADPAITIQTEHHKNLVVTLTSVGGLSGTIALTCANLPQFASCNFPAQAPSLAANAAIDTTIDIDTDLLLNFQSRLRRGPSVRSTIALAVLFPLGLIAIRRRFKISCLSLFSAVALLAIVPLTGCSGHYPGHTPPGAYTFTISGTAADTGITHATSVTLLVTK